MISDTDSDVHSLLIIPVIARESESCMVTSQRDEIERAIQSLKSEITELQARLEDKERRPNVGTVSSVAKRMLLSAQRVEELVSAAYSRK